MPVDPITIFYPEVRAGGFSRADVSIEFFNRVNALIDRDMTVVDFGAGRGEHTEDPVAYRRTLAVVRGKVARVIGVDVDAALKENPLVDEAVVIEPGGRWPLDDESVDLVYADSTFEHVHTPEATAAEIDRILVPGGWLCARTPNRWGYAAIGGRLVPDRLHPRLLRRLQPYRKTVDVFPTVYRMNSVRALRRLFPRNRWEHIIYTVNAEPAYFGFSKVAWALAKVTFRFIPERFGTVLMIYLRKR